MGWARDVVIRDGTDGMEPGWLGGNGVRCDAMGRDVTGVVWYGL